jgi:transmembrane 9 superfamily protein 2/4
MHPTNHFVSGVVLVALVASSLPVHAFYLPGAAPHDYTDGEKVDLFVNALTPMLPGSDDAKLVRTHVLFIKSQSPDPWVNLAEVTDQLYGRAMPSNGRLSDLTVTDDYYHPSFQFCEPPGGPHKQPESLGSILFGDRIFDSPYNVRSPYVSCHVVSCLIRISDSNVGG